MTESSTEPLQPDRCVCGPLWLHRRQRAVARPLRCDPRPAGWRV